LFGREFQGIWVLEYYVFKGPRDRKKRLRHGDRKQKNARFKTLI